jgi:hypothetical protein
MLAAVKKVKQTAAAVGQCLSGGYQIWLTSVSMQQLSHN